MGVALVCVDRSGQFNDMSLSAVDVLVFALPCLSGIVLAHQNRTIAISSDFCVDRAKSPEVPRKEGVWSSEIAT